LARQGAKRTPQSREESIFSFPAQFPHSQKYSTLECLAEKPGRGITNSLPSRKYKNGTPQSGLAHCETIIHSCFYDLVGRSPRFTLAARVALSAAFMPALTIHSPRDG
jgi:hypothetical protein